MDRKDITRYKEIYEKAMSADIDPLKEWSLKINNIKNDTFSKIPKTDIINYFINHKKILESLIFDLGIALKGIETIIMIVGPFGCGKTSLMHLFESVLNNLKGQNIVDSNINGVFINANRFEKIDNNVNFIFIDDATIDSAEKIKNNYKNVKFKVLLLSPFDFWPIYKLYNEIPKIHLLPQFNLENLIELLNKRIEYGLINKNRKTTIFDFFDMSGLHRINDLSAGVPLLILEYVSICLKLKLDINNLRISPNDKQTFRINVKIAYTELQEKSGYMLPRHYSSLRETKRLILNEILVKEKTPSYLSKILKKDRTTISRHLSELKKLGYVNLTKKGKEFYYKAKLPFRIYKEKSELHKISKIIK